jgi:predicted nucleic acid-binding Zn ribbon protein
MPQRDFDENDDWIEDELDDDESDADLLICPECTRPVHEDTQQCPFCGNWITPEYPRSRGKSLIWLVAAAIVILSMLMLAVL